jgi:DNA ligase-associated metallophosphoesterase
MITQSIRIKEQQFVLHPSGTLFWVDQSMLLISDVHLGKVSHFRKFGAAVPSSVARENFRLLDQVVASFHPKMICFLGDLFHSSINLEFEWFEKWVSSLSTKCILITGNHDIISSLRYEALGIEVKPEMQVGEFILTHHPISREGLFNFSGHIHPAVRLNGLGRQQLRVPCFFKSHDQVILPAFGKFTGTFVMHPKLGDEVYAIAKNEVILVATS